MATTRLAFGHSEPRLHIDGRALVVSYASREWRIDPAFLGAHAQVRWNRHKDGIRITVTQATLPGTDLRVAFIAHLFEQSNRWLIRLRFPYLGFDGTQVLADWLTGNCMLDGEVRVRRLRLGAHRARFDGSAPHLAFSPDFGFSFSGRISCANVIDDGACVGDGLTLTRSGPARDSLRLAMLGSDQAYATTFHVRSPSWSRDRVLMYEASSSVSAWYRHETLTSFSGEAFHGRRGLAAIATADGSGWVETRHLDGGTRSILRLERASLAMSGGDRRRVAIAGRLARRPHAMDLGRLVVSVCGDDDQPFSCDFGSRGATILEARAFLQRAWVPVGDTAVAELSSVAGVPIRIALRGDGPTPKSADRGTQHGSTTETATARADVAGADAAAVPGNYLVLGPAPSLTMGLGGTRLNLKRGLDLFNLDFEFTGFDLVVNAGTPSLKRHRPKHGQPWGDATVTVLFPPQAISEEITTSVQNPTTCMTDPGFPDVSRARMSGPSRIVFGDPPPPLPNKPKWLDVPLTIDALTDWQDLALLVNWRANDLPLDQQLKKIGITQQTPLADAMPLIAATIQPPAANETALELTERLIFSPSSAAKWITPRGTPNPTASPLWAARLDPTGRASVRAVWSQYLLPGYFNACTITDPAPSAKTTMDAVDAKTQWEIVAQTSVYGLPALRRISELKPDDPNNTLPRSRVIRPDPAPQYLLDLDSNPLHNKPESGIAMPSSFGDANVFLTALGASVLADWRGEPPLILTRNPNPPTGPSTDTAVGFSLEHLRYQSHVGRVIRVDAVSKGFMMPLSNRASFVQVTERRFFKHPTRGYPVAYPIQRSFIVIQKPDKQFPCVNQPYDSRDFPARSLTMLTRITPDLIDPTKPQQTYPGPTATDLLETDAGGLVAPTGSDPQLPPLVFWPKTQRGKPGDPGDVEFKWTIDDSHEPAVSKLLFVENTALEFPAVTARIVDYYRRLQASDGTPWAMRRTAHLPGASIGYATATKEGSTSYNTSAWLLSTRGRLLPAGPNQDQESFDMDGLMEGADQPPWYPVVDGAKISIQTLDRFLGRPQGLIEVGFDPTYVHDGFSSSTNPSEIYLDVRSPPIALDVTSQGGSSGGIAKPNTLVAALSRKIGLVGGKPIAAVPAVRPKAPPLSVIKAQRPAKHRPRRTVVGHTAPATPYDFSSAMAGKFNPQEFLGGIAHTKLLGIVDLKDVLSVIDLDPASGTPLLLETIGYGAQSVAGQELQTLQTIADGVIDSASKALAALESSISSIPHFADLYPDLRSAMDALESALVADKATIDDPNTDLTTAAGAATHLVVTAKALLTEVQQTVENPVPPLVQNAIQDLNAQWTGVQTLARSSDLGLGRQLQQQVFATGIGAICDLARSSGLGTVLFGLDPNDSCDSFAESPTDVIAGIENALFVEAFAKPLLVALTYSREYEAETDARISVARATLAAQAQSLIANAASTLEDRLSDPGGSTANILHDDTQRALALQFIDQVRKATDAAAAPGSAAPDITTLRQILATLPSKPADFAPMIVSTIQQQTGLFVPKSPPDLLAIVKAFTDAVAPTLATIVADSVAKEIQDLDQVLAARLAEARADTLTRLFGALHVVATGMGNSIAFARAAQIGEAVSNWCANTATPTTARAILLADNVASKVLADAATLQAQLGTIISAANSIVVPPNVPPDIAQQIKNCQASLLGISTRLSNTLTVIDTNRQALDSIAASLSAGGNSDICSRIAAVLEPVRALMNLRRAATSLLLDFAQQLAILQGLLNSSGALAARLQKQGNGSAAAPLIAIGRDNAPILSSLVGGTSDLLQSLTSIGSAVAASAPWPDIQAAVTLLAAGVKAQLPDYATQLSAELSSLQATASRLHQRLSAGSLDAQALRDIAQAVAAYSTELDKQLVALVLQSVSLTADLVSKLAIGALGILQKAAALFVAIHGAVGKVLDAVLAILNSPVVRLVMNGAVVDRFTNVRILVGNQEDLLSKIVATTDPQVALDQLTQLLAQWEAQPPAVVQTVTAFADVIEHLLNGDLAVVLNVPSIQGLLQDLEGSLESIMDQLLPTSIDLSYGWNTKIGNYPNSQPIFSMTDPSTDQDLVLTASVYVNLVTNTRHTVVSGKLKRFTIDLVGQNQIARIYFSGATFSSQDGSTPQFDAKIESVTLGTYMQFVEPLQQWMSPKGGFYVRPAVGMPAIEAGYTFTSSLIAIADLEFINVSIGISVLLPFDNNPALLSFNFGSGALPFLISCVPYGGGGYVNLISTLGDLKPKSFELSFVFGGMAAISFGPLDAQGRLDAGIYLKEATSPDGRGYSIFGALVEAAGEGSIGCFGIAVMIKVGMEEKDGQLDGFTDYEIDLSIGIVDFSFFFEAKYHISGGDKKANGRIAAANQVEAVAFAQPPRCPHTTIKNAAPRKSDNWRDYRSRVALGLLAK
jgi:hypothetical protein